MLRLFRCVLALAALVVIGTAFAMYDLSAYTAFMDRQFSWRAPRLGSLNIVLA